MLPATLVFGSSPKNPVFQEQHSDAVSRMELVGGAQELSREERQHLGPCPDGGGTRNQEVGKAGCRKRNVFNSKDILY